VRVGASGKAKRTSIAFVANQSIVDRASETETEDIMRWEGGRAWCREKLREWKRGVMKKIEMRTEDIGMWATEGSEGIGSSLSSFGEITQKRRLSIFLSP
jgi:hypothetical protein